MRVLQVFHGFLPRARARAGGEVGTYQTLRALVELGHEVQIAACGGPYDLEPEVRRLVAGVHWLAPRPLSTLGRIGTRLFQPDTLRMRFPDLMGYASQLRRIAEHGAIELVWADSAPSIAVAPRRDLPVIYGHYDFLHLLKPVRAATRPRPDLRMLSRGRDGLRDLRAALRRPDALSLSQLEEIEIQHCREAALVVSVSPTVTQSLIDRGIRAHHIPIVGETLSRPTIAPTAPLRLFLFGNNNTANRAVLREIREHLHPRLAGRRPPVEWHQVGTVKEHELDEDWKWVQKHFTRFHGYVPDLSAVMRPGDVSVVAYHFDTGGRAKFAVTAGHGVVSAGYDTSFLCAPEFRPGVDCIAAPDAEALAETLAALAEAPEQRASLARGARETYEHHFTFEAQVPRYQQALETAVSGTR